MIETCTGAWSRRPVAAGCNGVTSTSTVGELLLASLALAGVVATEPTELTLPGVVELSGKVIVTGSPTFTSDCCAASSWIVTCRFVVVNVSTGPGCTAEPTVGVTDVTRTGPGSNTTAPGCRTPVSSSPCSFWNALIRASVALVNSSPLRPSAAFNSPTSAPADMPDWNGSHGATEPYNRMTGSPFTQ